jgi:hypothetical protein
MRRQYLISAVLLAILYFSAASPTSLEARRNEVRWWKGNLHTHSLWSDGDDYPEPIVDWYKQAGYHFLALSDHNILSAGERWIDPLKSRGGLRAWVRYRKKYGSEWVQERDRGGVREARLRGLEEFRPMFEEPGRFLLIQSEEITDTAAGKPIHLNATNVQELIRPQGGATVLDAMQRDVDAVLAQRQRTGRLMFPHVNHPNFGWAVTAEELMQVRGERFFEVYNGHPTVHNTGDARRASTERMWDIILTRRLGELGLPAMFGMATDDAHEYHRRGPDRSNAGRGWVMVRADQLTPDALLGAMEAGDFYATSGVVLRDVQRGDGRLRVRVASEPGVSYRIQFFGTRRGYDAASEPVLDTKGAPLATTRRYSPQIGALLAETRGTEGSYVLKGDELYVRARIVSTRGVPYPTSEGGVETAWTQPLVPTE